MPVEAIALPVAIWGLWRGFARVGNYFFMGSLFGTAITDLYIHNVNLLPQWRAAMQLNASDLALQAAMQEAMVKMQSQPGLASAAILGLVLLSVGLFGACQGSILAGQVKLPWWAFSGAVLFTLVVDSLFGLGAWLEATGTI